MEGLSEEEKKLVGEYEKGRAVPTCPPPRWIRLKKSKAFGIDGTPQLAAILSQFEHFGLLDDDVAMDILFLSTAIMRSEPNCVDVNPPVVVVGITFLSLILFVCFFLSFSLCVSLFPFAAVVFLTEMNFTNVSSS
jgi:hypothetical protein